MIHDPMKMNTLENLGLKAGGKLDVFFSKHKLDAANDRYNGMRINHEAFTKAYNTITNDPGMNEAQSELMIGTKGEKVLSGFLSNANTLLADLNGYHNHLESKLFSNSVKLSDTQLQLFGVVAKQFETEGLQYLDRSPYIAPVVTSLAKAGVLKEGIGEMVIEKMDNLHSRDSIQGMDETKKAIEGIEYAISEEREIIEYHSPRPEKLQQLRNSSAAKEIKKITEGV